MKIARSRRAVLQRCCMHRGLGHRPCSQKQLRTFVFDFLQPAMAGNGDGLDIGGHVLRVQGYAGGQLLSSLTYYEFCPLFLRKFKAEGTSEKLIDLLHELRITTLLQSGVESSR